MATDTEGRRKMADLLEKLRARAHRSWDHTSKVMRNSIVDKRQQTELSEKSSVQQHLDILQKAFKVTNVVSMVERLESLARTVNLKYNVTHGGSEILLSSDMFCVQVVLDNTALVKDVIISHNGDATLRSCPEFVDALSRSDFEEVQAHLEGLISIYQINGDKKQRTKILHTIQALEADLQNLSQLSQRIMNGVSNYIHKSPVGILQPRVGGKPMRLTYFVGPYDLLDEKTGISRPLTVEEVTSNLLGYSATIGIESSIPRKLQNVTVMTVQTVDGNTLPSFSALTHVNSGSLPAVFVLCLHQPVPLSLSVVRKIQNITSVEFADLTQTRPLLSLILSQMTRGKQDSFDKDKGLFVTLSDQQHCYFMNGINGTAELAGLMVSRIPFTHPCHVAQILFQLRQQVLFNSFIGSCMRPFPNRDLENSLIFEVTPISLQHVSVTFEHPVRESMATAEFDLSDPTNVRCRICSTEEEKICTDEYACKVVQRCLSLPVTMRSILQKATANIDHAIQLQAAMAQTAARSKLGQERRTAFLNTHNRDTPFATPPHVMIPKSLSDSIESMDQGFRHPNNIQSDVIESFKAANDQISKTPILANLLDQDSESPEPPPPSMLSALLGDNPAPNAGHKPKKPRKRRITSDAKSPGTGKSPKRKMSEDDVNRDFPGSMDVDFDGNIQGNSHQLHRSGNTSSGSQTPNEDFGVQESHVSRLASTLDNIIKAESKNYPGSHPQMDPQETGTYINEVNEKDVTRIKEENGGEGVPIKTEPSSSSYSSHSSKGLQSSLVALLNDNPDEPGSTGSGTPPNSVVTPQAGSYGGRISQSKHVATNSSKNSLVSPQGLPTPASAGLTTQITTKSTSLNSNRKSLSKNDSYEYNCDPSPKDITSTSNSLLAKIISDWPEGSESGRRTSQSSSSASQASGSSGSSGVHSKSSSNVDKKFPEERSNSSKGSDSWEDRVTMKEKVKRERTKEDHDGSNTNNSSSGSSSKPPQEREKLGITFKLNIKDQTATAIVKASPSRDSPHHGQDGETGRGSSKDSSSSSKSSKEFKTVKASPARIYDLVDDSPTNLARTMLVATDGKPGSPSIRIKKIRHEGSSSEKKRKSNKHGDISDMGKRKKEDGKKDKSSGKRRKVYEGSSEFSDSKSVSNLKYSLEKGSTSTSIKITSASGKLVQSSSKSSSTNRSSSKPSLPCRPSSLLKTHMSEKSSKSGRALTSKTMMRSKSESQVMKMGDSKLNKTPTIKLKPLVIPGSSTTVTLPNTKTASTAPVPRNSTDPMAAVAAAALAKGKPQIKSRKNLTAVIDKLTKQQNTPGSGPGGLGIPRRESPTPPFKKDPIAEKNKLEAIRKEIIRAGNKPSTPTKELYKSSQRKDQSFSLDKVDRKNDHINRSSLQSSNSLQKSSSKLPSNNTTKIGLMSKVSSSGGISSQNSSSGDGSSSKSSLSKDYSSSSSMSNSKSTSSGLSGSSSSNSESSNKSKSLSSMSSSSSNLSSVHHGSSDSYNPRTDSTESNRRETNLHKDSYRDSHSSKDSFKDSHNSLSYKEGHSSKDGHRDFHSREGSHKESHVSKDSQKESSQMTSLPSSSTTQTSSSVPTSYSSLSSSSSSSSTSTPVSNTTHVKDSTAKESSLSSASTSEKSRSSSSSSSSKANKLEDHGDRTQSRHFLDAVTKIEHSSSSGSHKDGERKSNSRSAGENSRSESSRGQENSRSESSSARSENSRNDSNPDRESSSVSSTNSGSDKSSKPNGQISNHGSRTYDGRPVDPRLYKDENLVSGPRQESSRLPNAELVNGSASSSTVSNSSAVSASSGSKSSSSSSSSASGPSGSSGSNPVNHSSGVDAGSSSSSVAPPCSDKNRLMVLNSDLSNSEDKENKEDDKLFKAPTPKSVKSNSEGCDVVTERNEVKVRREKPILSPRSDVSSPDDGLVIDCPGTPGNRSVRSPGPKSNEKSSPNSVRSPGPMNSTSDSSTCRSPVSVVNKSPRSPSPRKPVNKSPAPSPNAKSPMMPRNSPLPAQHHSPCEIDDELMDAALMPYPP